MSRKNLKPIERTHLKRGDTTFKILDEEQQKKDLEEQQKKDLEKQKKIKTRKYRGSLNGADALRNLVRIEGSNHDLTISDPLKLTDSSLSHSMRDYRQGSREKSSEKRESRSRSRSRSKSNTSNVVAEESMSNGSNAMIKNEFENPIDQKSKNKSFLPSLMKDPSKQTRNLVQILKPNIMIRARLPKMGGRKKTAKRRRVKKSCGWF
jgi:hypothetical protein